MARRGKSNGRRKRGFIYGGTSDDSDEDYTVDEDDEVEDESEDGFVGDESEESLDELKSKKVKRIVRSRAPPRRKRNGTVGKPRKRKRVSYREDDDEGDDDDGVDKDDDEEFRPDCFDEEDEEEKFPVMKGANSLSTPWVRTGTVKDDDYEEDEDDEGFNPDGLEEDDEFPVVKGMENSSKPRLSKGISKDDDEDEDKEDEEFTPDGLEEDDEFPVVKGMKNSRKPRLHKGISKDGDDKDEDEEDEEFTPDGLDEDDEFPVVKGMKNSSKPRLRKRISKDDYEDEDEEDEEFTPDGLDEEDDSPEIKRMKNSSKPRLRKGISKDDGEDEDEEDEEITPDGLDEEEDFPVHRINNSSKPRLRKGISKDDDENEDEEDEEFTPDGLDEEDDSPEIKRMKNSSKPRLCKGISKDDGEDEDEEDEEFTPDGLDEEEDFPVNKINNSSKPRLRKGISKDDDEYEGEEGEEFTPDGLVGEEYSPVNRIKNSSKPRLRKGISKEDDVDEDEEDEEFAPDGLDEEEDFPVIERMKNSSEPRLREGISKEDDEEEDVEGEEFTPDGLDEEEDFSLIKTTRRSRVRKDDEDDEEFTPDSLDEEEEFPAMDYSLKPRMRRKGIAKEHKRNRNPKELRRMTRKKPQKGLRLKRKARSAKEEEFIDIGPVVGEKIARKRKKLREDSDSDFVASSGPSDHEFTISEEEREQIREASKFCKGLVTVCRSSTSLKNPPKEEAPRPQRKFPGRKDKLKVEELKTEAGKQICGICLSEQGKRTVRGTLNCCSHYFCYACIMEWSKVESRCPLCKQRFVTISKPAKSNTGFDLRTVVIQVPERDQVYQPSEEELRGYLDPYEDVLCTECQQGGDDALMLLCDLCDSPAHTYCVGLGREVPEGNWYCESCRPTALASLNQQNLNTPPPDNRTSSNYSVGSPPTPVLTFDLNEMYVPDTPMAEESPGDFQSPRDGQVASLASGFGAHTVSDRRRIHLQIHQMLNDRRRQFGNSITGTLSGNRLFGSQIARTRDLVAQPAIAQRAVQHNNPRLSHYRSGLVPERSSNMSRQLNLNGASTSRSFFGEFLESELRGTDANMSLGLVHQQLHPCSSSRSYVGPDSSPSPCPFRESTVPSRTLPNTLRRPF